MKRLLSLLSLFLLLCIIPCSLEAAQPTRRPIDSQHPLWMIHVDVWNQADPQKIIDLIPADIRPYICLNLSLSCSYDTELNIYRRPQNGVASFKSWATVCQLNGCWFTCQPASGGHTHIQDDDLDTFEYFFRHYPNFLGWNYAEQFWGFDEAGDRSSSSQTSRLALFANLVPMHHEYGGFLTVSFCGNIWSHGLNPMGMMKRNHDLYEACKAYPDAMLWLYKYTTSSCFYNNESVTFAPFIAGLAQNYGVRYDNCGWNGAIDALMGENSGCKYPGAAGIGTIMEQTCVNGGSVWDGPELIWTEDFQNLSNTRDADGYTQRNWGTFPNFRNIWIDMFRQIIQGKLYIPTREEVVNKTKIYVINDIESGSDEEKYAAWGSLYDGLYKTDDPFNRGDGQWMNNFNYMKQSGRYGAIPVGLEPVDALGKSIATQVKKSAPWANIDQKVAHFNNTYPEVSQGDLYVNRYRNQLVTYNPYTYLNKTRRAEASIPLQYNSCQTLKLSYGLLSAGYIREYSDHIDLYLNNYRNDTTDLVNDVITIEGFTGTPTYTMTKHDETVANASANLSGSTYTLTVSHNGPLELTIQCQGNGTGRKSDVLPTQALPTPTQPSSYNGTLTFEAEDMDYKGTKSCQVTPYYSEYQSVRGFTGNGFIDLGTGTSASLRHRVSLSATDGTLAPGGTYTLRVRYSAPSGNSSLTGSLNGNTALRLDCPKTATNEWKYASTQVTLTEGVNLLTLNHTDGIEMYVDNFAYIPEGTEAVKNKVIISPTEHVTITPSVEEAAEGTLVRLTVQVEAGYQLDGWRVLTGGISVSDDLTFTMPDCHVKLQAIISDPSMVYQLDFSDVQSGSLPAGWISKQEDDEVHEYPNSYGNGSRTFSGFTGYQQAGLYWRSYYAEYGSQAGYRLRLTPGKYQFHFAMAAWKGTPQFSATIVSATDQNNVLISTQKYTATPNADGKTSADLSAAKLYEMEFTVEKTDNYLIRFTTDPGWNELLLLACNVRLLESYYTRHELTNLDYHRWTAADATGTITDIDPHPAYALNTSTDLVYGDANVYYLNYADLTRARLLTITVQEGTPRLIFNRLVDESKDIITYPDNHDFDQIITNDDGTKTYLIDVTKIITSTKGRFAHLHAIKAPWNTQVTVTSIEYTLRGDIDENGRINTIDVNLLRDVILKKANSQAIHDVNLDGRTTIGDITTTLDFGGNTTF